MSWLDYGIEAAFFDLGGTIAKAAEPAETVKRVLKSSGIVRPISEIREAHEQVKRSFDVKKHVHLSHECFWTQWNTMLLGNLGIQGSADTLSRYMAVRWWDFSDLKLYPDASTTLVVLKRMGLRLGIISNGFHRDIEEVLDKIQLTHRFDVVVGVDDARDEKPGRRIFQFALDALDVPAERSMFVGDDYKRDYVGANKIGMLPILIDRGDLTRRGIRKIRSLSALLDPRAILQEHPRKQRRLPTSRDAKLE